jgi:hypothetical protein
VKFRSKFEAKFSKSIPPNLATYEDTHLKYEIPASSHTYTPDFRIHNTNIFLELKGIFSLQDRKKHLLLKEQYPQYRIIIVFQNYSVPINKGSKTTYSQWCEKNNIEWMSPSEALGLISTCAGVKVASTQPD